MSSAVGPSIVTSTTHEEVSEAEVVYLSGVALVPKTAKWHPCVIKDSNTSAAKLVGRSGAALFAKKWYPCLVKMDNKDGTIKVRWDDDSKKNLVTKRLPVKNFALNWPAELEDCLPDDYEPDGTYEDNPFAHLRF